MKEGGSAAAAGEGEVDEKLRENVALVNSQVRGEELCTVEFSGLAVVACCGGG